MKTKTLLLTVLAALLTLTSCVKNDDRGDWIARATVVPTENGSYDLLLDDSSKFKVEKTHLVGYAPKPNQRVFIEFSYLSETPANGYDATIELYYIRNILTKNVVDLTAENESEMGNNKLYIHRIWVAGGFLNVNFAFWGSGMVTHTINLVNNTIEKPAADGKVHLELRYNNKGDELFYRSNGYVSFDLKSYLEDNPKVEFVIKTNELEVGEKSYTLTNGGDSNKESDAVFTSSSTLLK